MPTMRSQFSLEQFETVLQKLAHEIAIDAVETMQHGDVSIVIHGSRLSSIRTSKCEIKFYAKHVFFSKKISSRSWLSFDAEGKHYLTSNHASKISFWAPDDEIEEYKAKVTEFIARMMTEASITPVPRFALSQINQPPN